MEKEITTSEAERLAKTVGGWCWIDYTIIGLACGMFMFCAAVLWWAFS